ncbi:MAG: YceI family protein [Planctomycetes bacterium]|nr:YceI family protein [Planctomycetota bacterium]
MTRKFFLSLAILTFLTAAGTQFAAAQSAGEVDLEKSQAIIFVDKTGFGHQHAVVGKLLESQVRLGARESAGRIVFDMTSFVADPPEARRYLGLEGEIDEGTRKKVTSSMLGRKVLDVKNYPTAVFEINSATIMPQRSRQGHPRYSLQGEFTLHGVTQPLTIQADAVPAGDRIRLRGGFYLTQTQYGITPFTAAFGTVGVKDRLTVYGEIYVAK